MLLPSAEAEASGSMKTFHLSALQSLPILPEGVSYGLPGFTVRLVRVFHYKTPDLIIFNQLHWVNLEYIDLNSHLR